MADMAACRALKLLHSDVLCVVDVRRYMHDFAGVDGDERHRLVRTVRGTRCCKCVLTGEVRDIVVCELRVSDGVDDGPQCGE